MHGETEYLQHTNRKDKIWFQDKRYLFTKMELDCSTHIISKDKEEFITKLKKILNNNYILRNYKGLFSNVAFF